MPAIQCPADVHQLGYSASKMTHPDQGGGRESQGERIRVFGTGREAEEGVDVWCEFAQPRARRELTGVRTEVEYGKPA